jgi:nucleoside diphosphate kinase
VQLVELDGFEILARRQVLLTATQAREFYAEHVGKPFFPRLQSFMTSGPIWALILAKNNAIAAWRTLMGPTDTEKAKLEAPYSLRALYGTGMERVCTPDTPWCILHLSQWLQRQGSSLMAVIN